MELLGKNNSTMLSSTNSERRPRNIILCVLNLAGKQYLLFVSLHVRNEKCYDDIAIMTRINNNHLHLCSKV